jgi:hypothetical protein
LHKNPRILYLTFSNLYNQTKHNVINYGSLAICYSNTSHLNSKYEKVFMMFICPNKWTNHLRYVQTSGPIEVVSYLVFSGNKIDYKASKALRERERKGNCHFHLNNFDCWEVTFLEVSSCASFIHVNAKSLMKNHRSVHNDNGAPSGNPLPFYIHPF